MPFSGKEQEMKIMCKNPNTRASKSIDTSVIEEIKKSSAKPNKPEQSNTSKK